jgi:hypothetical protein
MKIWTKLPEVASATMTEVAKAVRDQYDNVLVMMRRNPRVWGSVSR